MKITIVGAGNMGLAIAGWLSLKHQYDVVLYTQKNMLENGRFMVADIEQDALLCVDAMNIEVTASKERAFTGADVVLCTYPAFIRKQFIKDNEQYLETTARIGFVPGYGGIEYSCQNLIEKGVTVFGLQRVPYVARMEKTDREIVAKILSKKSRIYAAALPHSRTEEICSLLEELLDIPCTALEEYLAVTLAPSNPLLHLTGLYNIFRDYQEGTYYPEVYSFYGRWNDETSDILLKYDEELQNICKKMEPLDLHEVVSLKLYYESPDSGAMTKKLKSIKAFDCVKAPMVQTEKGYIPDFHSRMFLEDYPYGICVIKSFALMVGEKTPVIDMLLDFYYRLTGIRYFHSDGSLTEEAVYTGIPITEGLDTKEKIIEFYKKQG